MVYCRLLPKTKISPYLLSKTSWEGKRKESREAFLLTYCPLFENFSLGVYKLSKWLNVRVFQRPPLSFSANSFLGGWYVCVYFQPWIQAWQVGIRSAQEDTNRQREQTANCREDEPKPAEWHLSTVPHPAGGGGGREIPFVPLACVWATDSAVSGPRKIFRELSSNSAGKAF